jgi:hypothetical protein
MPAHLIAVHVGVSDLRDDLLEQGAWRHYEAGAKSRSQDL